MTHCYQTIATLSDASSALSRRGSPVLEYVVPVGRAGRIENRKL